MEPMIETSTYLPLFRENGDWIERPDFMVLAALSQMTKIDTQHVYAAMLLEESLNPNQTSSGMSVFAKNIEKNTIRGNLTQRTLAGQVVLELARLAASTGKPPTVKAARRLVAFNQKEYTGKPTLESSFLREIEKSFSDFKDTLHLQAAMVCDPQLLASIEGDERSLRKFLGVARAFEGFIDSNVVSKSFKWTPWRVPTQIKSVSELNFSSLTDQELNAAMNS